MQTTQHEEYVPEPWVTYMSDEGWPYYYNEVTGESSWEVPTQAPTPVVSSELDEHSAQYEIPPSSHTQHTQHQYQQQHTISSELADDMEEMCSFFKNTCTLSHVAAKTAAAESIARAISTPKKLAKVWNRNDVHLAELQLDDDDSEEVAMALRSILAAPHPTNTHSLHSNGAMSTTSIMVHPQQQQLMRNAFDAGGGMGYGVAYGQDANSGMHSRNQTHNHSQRGGRNAASAGGGDDNLEFYETESVITHSTRNSRGSHRLQQQQQKHRKHQHAEKWVECRTAEGELYYYNETTQMVQWNSPYAHHQAMQQPQPQYEEPDTCDYTTKEPYIVGYSYNNINQNHIVGVPEGTRGGGDDDDGSVSDLSSGSESRQRRSHGYATADKQKKAKKERLINKKRLALSQVGANSSKNKNKLPAQYSKTMARANLYSTDLNSQASGNQNHRTGRSTSSISSRNSGGESLPHPTALNQRSLEVWSRFFENALRAKEDNGEFGTDEYLRSFALPPLAPNEWPVMLEDDEFADMIDTITSQVPSLTREKNLNIALIYAITASEIAVVERLLQLGADPNYVDMQERTPLHHAARTSSMPLVALVFDHGADAEQEDVNGHVPLHVACISGAVDVVQYLLESAVNVDCVDKEGRCVFHLIAHAYQSESISCYDLLLEYEANAVVYNKHNMHPLAYARNIRSQELNGTSPQHGEGRGVQSLIDCYEVLYSQLGVSIAHVQELPPFPAQMKDIDPVVDTAAIDPPPPPVHLHSNISSDMNVNMPPPAPQQLQSIASPMNSPNKNKPLWTSTLTVDLGGKSGKANSNNGGGTGIERPPLNGSNNDNADGRSKPSPTFPSPQHTPGRGNATVVGEDGEGAGEDEWVRDVNQRLRDRGSPVSIHSNNNNNNWLSEGNVTAIESSNGRVDNNNSTVASKESNSNFASVSSDADIRAGGPGEESRGVGEAVVGSIWATANSLMGVTMSMFNQPTNTNPDGMDCHTADDKEIKAID